jgi:hypothetical protein
LASSGTLSNDFFRKRGGDRQVRCGEATEAVVRFDKHRLSLPGSLLLDVAVQGDS